MFDSDNAVTKVDIGVVDDVVGTSYRRDRPVQIVRVDPIAQGMGPNRADPGAQRGCNGCGRVGPGTRVSPGTKDVVEMVVGHHQVGHLGAGQFADVLGDRPGLNQSCPAIDQQHSPVTLDQSHRDIEKRKPAPVHPSCQLLPVVMHPNNASCQGFVRRDPFCAVVRSLIGWTHVQFARRGIIGPRRSVSMRIAMLSYRSKTHCGGQGVYIRHLSRGLVELGHQVEVFSGQPYPEILDPRVRLTEVPSLDLYREPDPFRVPHIREIRDRIDLLELGTMWTGGFPEPRTFSLRAARLLAERSAEFDVVHDNQCLGTGLLTIAQHLPVVATVHHPITRDRVLDLDAAKWWRKPSVHRWYGFTDMQKRVARRIPDLLTVSSSSAADIADDFGVHPDQLHVVPLGVDTEQFRPVEAPRVPGRIIAISSADRPLKGIGHLLQAVARLRAGHDVELHLVAKLEPNGPTEKLIAELGISDIVRVVSGLSDSDLAALFASAEIACIPSLYEGFSLPAVEAMASGTPIVASRAGALPEVLGSGGECADLVAPGNVEELTGALSRMLDSPGRRRWLGAAGRRRALDVFSWESVAAQTLRVYSQAIERTGMPRREIEAVDEPC